jgi:hypothetical protein
MERRRLRDRLRAKAKNAAYYAANKARENQRCRAYHASKRDKRLAIKAAWREANREQQNAKSRARYHVDPEASREYHRDWRLRTNRAASIREWRERNAERLKERARRWYQENKPLVRAKNARRRARKNNATPAWADLAAIAAIYDECARISKETRVPHEVDHIIPLKGELVCGLHVHQNLRIVTRSANRRKSAKLEAEFEHSWFSDHSRAEGENPIPTR